LVTYEKRSGEVLGNTEMTHVLLVGKVETSKEKPREKRVREGESKVKGTFKETSLKRDEKKNRKLKGLGNWTEKKRAPSERGFKSDGQMGKKVGTGNRLAPSQKLEWWCTKKGQNLGPGERRRVGWGT